QRRRIRCAPVHRLRRCARRRRGAAAGGTAGRDHPGGRTREPVMSGAQAISVNARAASLVEALAAASDELRIAVTRGPRGERLIDAGAAVPGSLAAGLRMAEICMGGLGTVQLLPSSATPYWPWTLSVRSSNPVVACL